MKYEFTIQVNNLSLLNSNKSI